MFLSTIRVIQNKMSDRTPISIDNRLRALISQIGDANSPAQDLDIGENPLFKLHFLELQNHRIFNAKIGKYLITCKKPSETNVSWFSHEYLELILKMFLCNVRGFLSGLSYRYHFGLLIMVNNMFDLNFGFRSNTLAIFSVSEIGEKLGSLSQSNDSVILDKLHLNST